MDRRHRMKLWWTMWMAGGGVLTAAVVYGATGSAAWALVGLVLSGVALNALAQIITQPLRAVRARRPSDETGGSKGVDERGDAAGPGRTGSTPM